MRTSRLCLVFVLLAACSVHPKEEEQPPADLPDATSPFKAGSRLVPRELVGSDGSRHVVGWYDQELGMACDFHPTTEGFYCLPGRLDDANVFADAECQQLALRRGKTCGEVPAFVTVRATTQVGCDGFQLAEVYETGTVRSEGVAYEGDACLETAYDPAAFELIELAPTDVRQFVAARLETVALADEAWIQVIRAVDGAEEVRSLAVDGAACSPRQIAGGDSVCVPQPAGQLTDFYYADASCSEEVAVLYGYVDGCGAPPFATRTVLNEQRCSVEYELFSVTGEQAAQSIHAGPMCEAVTPEAAAGFDFLQVGAPANGGELPATRRTHVGEARLQSVEVGFALAQEARQLVGIYDAQLGVDCRVQAFGDGTEYCVPVDVGTSGHLYADDACLEPLTELFGCQLNTPPEYALHSFFDACANDVVASDAFEVGEAHSGAVFQRSSPTGPCEPFEGEISGELRRLTPVSPAEAFVELGGD